MRGLNIRDHNTDDDASHKFISRENEFPTCLKTRDHSTICSRVAQTPETTAPCQRKSHINNSIGIKFQRGAQKKTRTQHHLSTQVTIDNCM